MKKILIGAAVAVVLIGVFGAAGYVYAQASTPTLGYPGYGMMGGRGGMMGYQTDATGEGVLHDKMAAAIAEKLGMSASDLETRLEKGETMLQVAESKGINSADFFTLMTEVRTQVLDQAVKDGSLTQDKADWMKQRGSGMGYGRGSRGAGRGNNLQGNCPYMDGDEN